MTKSKLTFPDYMLTIMYFTSNFKHLLLLEGMLKLIQAQKGHLTFCHWNLNGLVTYDFIKVPLVETFTATSNFDIICLSETFLDSTITDDDENTNKRVLITKT